MLEIMITNDLSLIVAWVAFVVVGTITVARYTR